MTLEDLATQWREQAQLLDRYGADQLATTCRVHADELEAAMRAAADETLTLEEAAAESGYSRDRLRHLVAAGEVPQAGRRGAPRIRRADLPRKHQTGGGKFDPSAAAQRVLRKGSPA